MSPALAAQPITPRVDDTQIDQCFDAITDLKMKIREMERAVTELESSNEKAVAQLAVAQNVLKFLNARYQSQKAEMEVLRQRVSFLETKMGVAMREDDEDDEDDEDEEDDEDDEDSQDGEDGEEEGGECATSGAMESQK